MIVAITFGGANRAMATPTRPGAGGVCVHNATPEMLVFAAEAEDGKQVFFER